MSWQSDLFLRLRDREWQEFGALFESIEAKIPLHNAMRAAMQPSKRRHDEMPTPSQARWQLFLHAMSQIGVESSNGRPWKWTDRVRLRYVAGRVCDNCAGPVIKASWSAKPDRNLVCLACEQAAKPPVSVCRPVVPIIPIVYFPDVPAQFRSHEQRHLAKAIKARYSIGLSINEIVRQLQRWGPVQIIQRYRQATRRPHIW